MLSEELHSVECYEKTFSKGDIGEMSHSHEYIEFVYVCEGELLATVNGDDIKAGAGDLLIINAGATHAFTTVRKKCRYYVIDFLPALICDPGLYVGELKYLMPFVSPGAVGRLIAESSVKKSAVPRLFSDAVTEYDSVLPGKLISVRSSLLGIFTFVIRSIDGSDFSFDAASDNELLKVMERAIEYMKENLADVNEKEIADMCGLSYSYFSRSFKRVIHMSFSEYCNKMRIAQSEKLLLETNKPISVIAEELGFSSASHYIQTFRKFRNCSPKKYRSFVHGKN